jgi:hypothetical protein
MAPVVFSRGRFTGRRVGPQQLLTYAAAAVVCLFLVSLLRDTSSQKAGSAGSSNSPQHIQHQGSPSTADQQQLDKAYTAWLATFKAADAAYQDYCMQVLVNSTRFKDKGGQANQDIFLFQNLYRYWPMQGRRGFYAESGANDPLYLSTSLFFDKCLGWAGLCVEPQQKFHKVCG